MFKPCNWQLRVAMLFTFLLVACTGEIAVDDCPEGQQKQGNTCVPADDGGGEPDGESADGQSAADSTESDSGSPTDVVADSTSADGQDLDAGSSDGATAPDATEPDASEPDATEPDASGPDTTGPDATEPDATEPDATEPDATGPDAGQTDGGQTTPGFKGVVFDDNYGADVQVANFANATNNLSIDPNEKYAGSASLKIEVPSSGYSGAALALVKSASLAGYTTLSFWAKASAAKTVSLFGIGNDSMSTTYQAELKSVSLTTQWKQYTIVLPMPSKLTAEKGVFHFSADSKQGSYTLWLDDIVYQSSAKVGVAKPSLGGGTLSLQPGGTTKLQQPQVTYTVAGSPQTLTLSPLYFDYASSDAKVATVKAGEVTAVAPGVATISAKLGGQDAEGNVIVEVLGATKPVQPAPKPTHAAAKVISLFSDVYKSILVDTWSAQWDQADVTDIKIGNDNVKKYTKMNFAGVVFALQSIDASKMTHVHIDIWSPDAQLFKLKLVDFGPDGKFQGGDDSEHEVAIDPSSMPKLENNKWVSVNIALSAFTKLKGKANLTQMVLSSTNATVFVDNLYFFDDQIQPPPPPPPAEPKVAAPAPTYQPNKVVSVFSDAYQSISVDAWSAAWDQADVTNIKIGTDNVKKYTNLSVAGIEVLTNSVDASKLTHMRVDLWTPDAKSLKIKLVDFGADGKAQGGDDSEHEVSLGSSQLPKLVTEKWISLDLPLKSFTGLKGVSSLAQIVLTSNKSILYVDNIVFYDDGTQQPQLPEPKDAAPKPTQDAKEVISLFSNVYTNVAVDSWAALGSVVKSVKDVSVKGDQVKKYTGLTSATVLMLSKTINASKMSHIHMDVWTPNAKQLKVKVVDFGQDGAFKGGDDSEHEVSFNNNSNPKLETGKWVSIDLPLQSFSGLKGLSNFAQMLLSSDNSVVYIDNVYLYHQGGQPPVDPAPQTPAPTPTKAAADVISLFSDLYTNSKVDSWAASGSQVKGLNEVAVKGNITKKYSGLSSAKVTLLSKHVDASKMTHLHMNIWSPDAKAFKVKVVDFGKNGALGGGDDSEHEITIDGNSKPKLENNKWVSVDLALKDFSGLKGVSKISQLLLSSTNALVYVDNVFFYSDGSGQQPVAKQPTAGAPKPTKAAAKVISLFSDIYTDVKIDTWSAAWDQADLIIGVIGTDNHKKYKDLTLAGVVFESQKINASKMTHFHMDIWSPDAKEFKFKLVDFGVDGAPKTADDSEHEITLNNTSQPKLELGKWISVDLPIKSFTNLGGVSNLAQLVMSSSKSVVFVDNVYFYTDGTQPPPLTNAPTTTAAAPMQMPSKVIALYSNTYPQLHPVDTWSATWDKADVTDAKAAKEDVKKYTNLEFAGVTFEKKTINATQMTHLHIDVWTPSADTFKVKLVDFGSDGKYQGGDDSEHEVVFDATSQPALTKGKWVALDIPLQEFVGIKTKSNLARMLFSSNKSTVFIDNVYFYIAENDESGEPQSAPPIPTHPKTNVISLFSDTYPSITVDTWSAAWDQADVEVKKFGPMSLLLYTNLVTAGMVFQTKQVDASKMTYLHMDIWSANANVLKIELVDFGPNGAYKGGDDSSSTVTIDANSTPALKKKTWMSIDLPLSKFTGLNGMANLAQMVLTSNKSKVYVDNIFFYKLGGGGGQPPQPATSPQSPAPSPTIAGPDVISLFSDSYSNTKVDSWSAAWDQADVTETSVNQNKMKKYTKLVTAGVVFDSQPINASSMSKLHLDVWTVDAKELKIKLIDFGQDGKYQGGDDSEHEVVFDSKSVPKLDKSQWVGLDLDLSSMIGLKSTKKLGRILISSNNSTVFVDNVYFHKTGGGGGNGSGLAPTSAAPKSTIKPSKVKALYSNMYPMEVKVDTWSAAWDNADVSDENVGPDDVKKYTKLINAGIEFTKQPLDAGKLTHMHIDVWTPNATYLKIKLVDFGNDGKYKGGDDSEGELTFSASSTPKLSTGQWISMNIPMQSFKGLQGKSSLAQIVLSSAGATVYVDNLFFFNGEAEAESGPSSPAPTPTLAEAKVISLFSDAYQNSTVDTWSASWDKADFQKKSYGPHNMLIYSNLQYAGIVFESKKINANNMKYLHIDIWTADAKTFKVKLIDFGKDAKYLGGDDSEGEVSFTSQTNPALTQGSWQSFEIPLNKFTGLNAMSNLAQMVLSSSNSIVWVDNIYFHN